MSEMTDEEIQENFQVISITLKWTAEDIQRRQPHWTVEQCEHFIDSAYREIAAEAQEAGDRMIDDIMRELDDEPEAN